MLILTPINVKQVANLVQSVETMQSRFETLMTSSAARGSHKDKDKDVAAVIGMSNSSAATAGRATAPAVGAAGQPNGANGGGNGSNKSKKKAKRAPLVTYLNVHAGVSVGVMAGLDVGAHDRFEVSRLMRNMRIFNIVVIGSVFIE